jgi:protein-disulfide isomerase
MAQNQKPGKDNFTRNLVVAVVVGVVLLMLVPTVLSKKSNSSAKVPSSVSAADGYGIVFNDKVAGVPTVDLYEDFQCPICNQFEQLQSNYIHSLISEKKARVVFHPLSFIGPDSVRAANAAACAADQGKFLAYHDALYANQPAENSGAWSNGALIAIGAAAGLTNQQFTKCVNNGEFAGWVTNVAAAGSKANVNSTPTVFVNGKELNRKTDYFNAANFKAAVEKG